MLNSYLGCLLQILEFMIIYFTVHTTVFSNIHLNLEIFYQFHLKNVCPKTLNKASTEFPL